MEKRIFKLYSVFVSLFLAVLLSCSDNTVPSPEMEKIEESESGSRAVLSAPQNVTVSQGGKREINITWDEVSKASRYYIYASDSLFSEYELVGESTKNSFTYSPLVAGITKYLRICSVDYEGNLSSKTEPVVGTTLAQPIISDITTVSGKEDSALVVYWYMENADFYKDELEYTIICKNSEGKEVANSNVYASELESTSFSLDDLKPSENYTYSVTAFLSSNPMASEVSLEVDAETARRLRPNPPEELAATEGTEKETITVSFKLPEKVDVLVAAKTYVQYPLYFKIYRRLSGSEDWGNAIVNHLYFTGDTEKPSDLDFTKYDEKRTADGYKVTWTDTTVTRGIKYEYKVQSYADDTTRIITSDLSSGETTGWAAAIPKFEAKSTFTANDEGSAYASVTISFDFDWDTFGNDSAWKFILKTLNSATFDDIDPATASYELLESLETAKNFSRDYDLTDSTKEGYYKYALIIAKADDVTEDLSGIGEKIFIEIPAATIFFLTSVINQPKLDSFALTDGFAKQTELSWTYESDCTYSLERKTLNVDGSIVEDSEIEIKDFGTPNEGDFSYTDKDSVESGKIYSYTLYATKEERIFPSKALSAKTLGTPSPKFLEDALAYDSITVSWQEVQKADSYKVALFDGETQLGEPETLDSEKISEILTAGVLTYKLSNPKGFDDATISGKNLKFKVTAKNSVDSCEGAADDVRTMGPAVAGLNASKATSSSEITVTWNEIAGAAGYILQRVRYDIPESGESTAQKTDVFYVGASGEIMFGETEISDSVLGLTSSDGKITLSDKQIELNSSNGYETSQALISSGVPFEYTVLPVLAADDSSEVASFKIAYENIDKITSQGSTHGFGHNVSATKAEYTNKIDISWSKPANSDGLKPTLYKRAIAASSSSSDSSEWENVGKVFAETDTSYTDGLSVTDANIYEYAVNYGKAGFSKAYLNLLASRKTVLSEQENRGYAFNMAYKANSGNEAEFAENFVWTPFDSSYRKAARVTGYTIYLKNTNYPHGWQKIASLDSKGIRTAGDDFTGDYAYNVTYDYTEKMPNLLTIKPATATAKFGDVTGGGSYEGLLKVLRDPRHYYKIVMEGEKTSDGTTYEKITFDPSSEEIADDMSIYACRQITDAELARAAMLTLTYAFYINDGGNTDYSNVSTVFKYKGAGTLTTPNGGSALFKERERATSELGIGKYKQYYTFTNYTPNQWTPSETSVSFISITAGQYSCGIKGDADNYIYLFRDTNEVSVTSVADIPINYSCSITFSCSGYNNLSLKIIRNGGTKEICNTSVESVRKYFFPMELQKSGMFDSNDRPYELASTYYGWWEE